MKKISKLALLVAVVLVCLCLLPNEAKATSTSDLTFKLNDDGRSYSVTDCKESASGELIIPNTYNGLPVTAIGNDAFFYCTSLTSVTIPDSVTTIGDGAFCYCSSLTNISIPDSVSSLGGSAFWACGKLKYNKYDNGLYLGNVDNPYLVLKNTTNDNITACTIHPATKFIEAEAFSYCSNLISVIIPDGVLSIGNRSGAMVGSGAFRYCTSLVSVTIPNSVKTIGCDSFVGCKSLTSVTIPDGITYIDDSAFGWCTSLTSVSLPSSLTHLGSAVFWNCTNLTSANIPDGVTSLSGTFAYCDSLTSIVIPDSITEIVYYAFSGCDGLTSLTIPESVTTIQYTDFSSCDNLTGIWVDENNPNYSSDSYGVLYNKDKTILLDVPGAIMSCTIPTSVVTIRNGVFDSLTDVYYTGTRAQWDAIEKDGYDELTLHFTLCAEEHSWDEGTVTKQTTCKEAGIMTHICGVCEETKTEEIAKIKSHTYTNNADTTCDVCDAKAYPGGNTLVKENGKWYHIKDREKITDTTLVKYAGIWFYAKDGVVDFSATTLCNYGGYWFYVKDGQVDFKSNTLCKWNGMLFHVKDGKKVNDTTLVYYGGSWFYVKNGQVDFSYSGKVLYNGKYYTVKKGVKV